MVDGTKQDAPARVAYILRSYPRLSQTHILNEILALERLGHSIEIFGMTSSGETLTQDGVAEVKGRAEFLDRALRRSYSAMMRDHALILRTHPLRYLRTATYLLRRSDLNAGYTTTTRRACFMQAAYLAAELQRRHRRGRGEIDHVHSHFAHDPTLIALLVGRLTGITYSFTAHARDMLQIPTSSLAERIKHATAVVTICQANVDYLARVAPNGGGSKVKLIHTGIDVEAFRPPTEDKRSGTPPLILVVSRLVEKKGMLDLIEALARVKTSGRSYRCVIYGDGPLRPELESAISERGVAREVELAGACTQATLRLLLQQGDLFALTPFVTEDGDREGLPSVILEAMACGLPVVSTTVAGIPEAVIDEHTGLLAEPHDIDAIAAHINSLLDDEALRRRLGTNGRAAIVRHWGAGVVARELTEVFNTSGGRP